MAPTAAEAWADAHNKAASGTASGDEVARELSADYPQSSLAWVKGLTWEGPKEIPLDQIDMTNRAKWNAAREPGRVAKMAAKITKRARQGRRIKPAVLVDTPATDPGTNFKVIDGHHRTLAYRSLSKPVWGYVAKVSQTDGPWDEFHARQVPENQRDTTDGTAYEKPVRKWNATTYLTEHRDSHGRWGEGGAKEVSHYKVPDPARLHSERSPYKTPGDHPFFQRNPVSPQHIVDAYDKIGLQARAQGARWYPDAHLVAKSIAGGNAEMGAGLLAAYSPQTAWPEDMFNAARSYAAGRAMGPGEGMITGNIQKIAQKILDGKPYSEAFKGPKTRSFAELIKNGGDEPDDTDGHAVIDRHALSVAIGHRVSVDDIQKAPIGDKRYFDYVGDQYREAAKIISERDGKELSPSQLQAIVWVGQQQANTAEDADARGASGRGRNARVANEWSQWSEFAREHDIDTSSAMAHKMWRAWVHDRRLAATRAREISDSLGDAVDSKSLAQAWTDANSGGNRTSAEAFLYSRGVPQAIDRALGPALAGIWQDGWQLGTVSAAGQVQQHAMETTGAVVKEQS